MKAIDPRHVVSLLFIILAALLLPRYANALEVERLRLPGEAGFQVYNYQEQRDWRVWARSAAGFKASQIWLQRRAPDGTWGEAAPWALNDPRYRDSDPSLDADGRRMVFVSDRPSQSDAAPQTQLDLFESHWDDAGWSAPRRLPEALQSAQYELGPEQHGRTLWFGSYRQGGPGRLAIYTAQADAVPQPLPEPINDGGSNSDPTLSPDGRYLVWWSGRSGDGDLYLAERMGGERHGPARRLPSVVNSDTGFEFTPWVDGGGEWLYFASTRHSEDAAGLAKLYRVRWPAVLKALGSAVETASQAELDGAVEAFWHALSRDAGAASDVVTLRALLHPEARIWGSSVGARGRVLQADTADEFLADLAKPGIRPLRECELARELQRYGAMAQVYSRVRTDREPGGSTYAGVNSQQWHWDAERGWVLLSMHYALDLPGQKLAAEGACLASQRLETGRPGGASS